MDLNDSTNTDFSGFSLSDLPIDSDEKHNGDHFNTVISCLGECVVITFHDQSKHDQTKKALAALYDFHINKDQTALTATTEVEGQRLVITCYKSLKIVIQGIRAKDWFQTIFNHLTKQLTGPEKQNVQHQYPPLRKSKSLLTKIKDLAATTESKYLKELKKAQKLGDNEYQKRLIEGWETGADIRTIKRKGSAPINRLLNQTRETDENQTQVKQVALQDLEPTQEQHDPLRLQNCSTPRKQDNDQNCSKHGLPTHHKKNQTEIQSATSPSKSETEVPLLKGQNEILQQENKHLKSENKKLTVKNNEQAKQIAKLQDCAESLKKTLNDTQAKANEQCKHITALSSKTKDLEKRLQECTTQSLLQEEQLSKSRKCIDKLQEEKQRVTNKLNCQNLDKDRTQQVESKVSTMVDEMSDLRTEISDMKQKLASVPSLLDIQILKTELKNDLKREIEDMKKQNERESKNTTIAADKPATPSSCVFKTKATASGSCSDVVDLTTCEQNPSATETETSHNQNNVQKPKILVIGDSVTKDLDSAQMSGKTLDVCIDSNPGAKVRNIKDKIHHMNKKGCELSQYDAVIIHAGINNISDAETPDQIMQNYTDIVQSVQNISVKTKIIISSILPKKHDKLSLSNITALNRKLNAYCKDRGLTFIDHTQNFKFNEKATDRTLFRDEIHLTSKGVAVLAKQLKLVLHKAFSIATNDTPNRGVNFQKAKSWKTPQHQRRWNQQHRWRIPPWAMYPHPW